MALLLLATLLVLVIPKCTFTQFTGSKYDPACHKKADVIFVLDASSSIYGPDFRKQLVFVKTIIQDLHIDPSMVRCGLVTYGDIIQVEFGLRSYSSADEVIKAVSRVEQLRGNTRTDLAIRKMMEMMADDKRSGVPQIGIVITDGESDNTTATRVEAEAAHNAEITMFAVGIGRKVNDRELASIASQRDFRFHVGSFDGLETIRKMLTAKACDVKSQNDLTTEHSPPQNIEGRVDKLADIIFVLDGSATILSSDFELQLKFVIDMVAMFQVSKSGTHVGVVTFGDNAMSQFTLDRYVTVTAVQEAMKRIEQPNGGANMAGAFSYVRQTSFTGRRHRADASKIAVVITGGQSDNTFSTNREAIFAKEDGITVFAIGVGSRVDKKELCSIASSASDQHVIMVENYQALATIKRLLMSRVCLKKPCDEGSAAVTYKMAISTTTEANLAITRSVFKTAGCESMKSADIMFSLPSSIDDEDTREVLRYIESMTTSLSVGDGRIRVGLAPRFCNAISGFSLEQGVRRDRVSSYIKQQNPSGRIEETAAMLRYLGDVGFNSQDAGSVKETVRIALVILDRRSTRLTQASIKESNRLRQKGIRVVAIVVGTREMDLEEKLSKMVGCDSCLLSAESYSGLSALVEPLKRTIMAQLCSRNLQ